MKVIQKLNQYFRGAAVLTLLIYSGLQAETGFILNELPSVNEGGFYRLYTPSASEDGTADLHLQHGFWYYSAALSSAAYSGRVWRSGFRYLSIGDIEVRGDQPSDEPLGETGYYAADLWLGRSLELAGGMLDLRGSLLFERLYYASARGLSLDLHYRRELSETLKLQLALDNLGSMEALETEESSLPLAMRAGLHYDLSGLNTQIAFAAGYHAAGETFAELYACYRYGQNAAVHGSYSSLYRAFHIAPSLRFGKYSFGLGKYFYTAGFDSPSMLNVAVQLGE